MLKTQQIPGRRCFLWTIGPYFHPSSLPTIWLKMQQLGPSHTIKQRQADPCSGPLRSAAAPDPSHWMKRFDMTSSGLAALERNDTTPRQGRNPMGGGWGVGLPPPQHPHPGGWGCGGVAPTRSSLFPGTPNFRSKARN